jgi:hypothetical protein
MANINTLRSIVDGNTDIFRYGLYKYDRTNEFDQPTMLGFTIEIDESSSPLFNELQNFFDRYAKKNVEIKARMSIYEELLTQLRMFFNSQETDRNEMYIKSHYINSVTGLNLLNNKFTKYGEDKLTFQLQEDIGMHVTYMTQLWKNLVYSYDTGRRIIPTNLAKFNIRIKISEIRNFTSLSRINKIDPAADDAEVLNALRNNVSSLIYTVWDCHFDAVESSPAPETITQAGIDAALPAYSTVGLDMYYRTASRFFRPSLIGGIPMDDGKKDLGLTGKMEGNYGVGTSVQPGKTLINGDGSPWQGSINGRPVSVNGYNGFANESGKKDSVSSIKLGRNADEPDLLMKAMNAFGISDRGAKSNAFDLKVSDPTANTNDGLDAKVKQQIELNDFEYIPNLYQHELNQNGTRKISVGAYANDIFDNLKRKAQSKRTDIYSKLVQKVHSKLGITRIVPSNVHKDQNYYTTLLKQIKSDIGFSISDNFMKNLGK